MRQVDEILMMFHHCQTQRTEADILRQEMAEIMNPQNAEFTAAYLKGKRVGIRKFNNRPISAKNTWVSLMTDFFIPSGIRWFEETTNDKDVNRRFRSHFNKRNEILYSHLYNLKSTFQLSLVAALDSLAVFGDSCIFCDKSTRKGQLLDIYPVPVTKVWAKCAEGYRIDGVFLKFEYTTGDIIKRFPNYNGQLITDGRKLARDKQCIIVAILENEDYDYTFMPVGTNKPYLEVCIAESTHEVLSIKGLNYNPYPFGRYKLFSTNTYPYGYSPTAEVFGDILTANRMARDVLSTSQRIGTPQIVAFVDDIKNKAAIGRPDTLIELKDRGFNRGNPSVTTLPTNAQGFPITAQMQDRVDNVINDTFMTYLLQTSSQVDRETAQSVIARMQERGVKLGAEGLRFYNEQAIPVIDNTKLILEEAKVLPPHPPELKALLKKKSSGVEIQIKSPAMKAQQSSTMNNVFVLNNLVDVLSQKDPTVVYKIDANKMIDDIADVLGVSDKVVDTETAQRMAAQAQEQAQAAQQAAFQQEMAVKAAGNLGASGNG